MRRKNKEQVEPKTTVTPPAKDGFSLISNEKLIALYVNLLKCRMAEQRAGGSRKRANGNTASMRGHQAGTVGVAIDLGPGDVVSCPEHGLLTSNGDGGPLEAIMALSSRSGLNGRNHSAKATSILSKGKNVAHAGHSATHTAIGKALASKTMENGKVAVVFGHDEDAVWWREALQIASVHGLPMIFVNHKDRETVPRDRSDRKSTTDPSPGAETPWFPNIPVDSNDVVAVYRVANEAISRARQGRGPTLIECQPFRLKNSNGNGRYSHDAVLNMERYLRGKGLFKPELKKILTVNATKA